MTLRAIHNHHNFFSDYWLGTLAAARGAAGPRLTAAQLRQRMRRLTRLVDALGGMEQLEPARFRERFVRPLLADVFDFALADVPSGPHVHALRPLNVPLDAPPVAAVYLCADASDLDRTAIRQSLETALAGLDLRHGLILTPTTVRLVRRAGDGPRLGALDVALVALRELEDDDSLQAAYRLVSAGCFVSEADGRRPIDVLEAESREHSAKVSAELKGAVFQAAELLVGAFQRDVESRPEGFGAVTPTLTEVRDAGFLALYRLLFILYAESRDERLANHRLYKESYGLEGLIGALLGTAPEHLAANRTRIWSRVAVLFRVFNDGLAPNLPHLENIPPRGGRLFSETSPEGRLLTQFRVDDRVATAVLLAIATTRPRRGVGRERVSFRELEIEQLGSVYEGLLEYEPAMADVLQLSVRAGNRELVLTPEQLVMLCEHKNLALNGDAALVSGTAAEQLHPANGPEDEPEQQDEEGEDDDEPEDDVPAIRSGQPIRLLRRLEPGTFYFRPGGARKASGSYYTPTPMVEYLVREALGPLTSCRSASEIELLRVVDVACGSAHFLVGAARFLGARLHEAYRAELGDEPAPAFAPPGGSPEIIRARWAAEGAAWCKRRVVERCLYGVDLNPAAVQLAQVALWIESLAGDRPLSFFAHHIRVGNSLQGTFVDRFDTAPDPHLTATRRDTATLGLFESNIRQRIEAALGERRLIDAELPPEIRADTPEEFQYKEDRLRRSERALIGAKLLMDIRSACPFIPEIWSDLPILGGLPDPLTAARSRTWWDAFERVRAREKFFHWELEFPEVLLRPIRPGFDAVLGNPPWDKVLPSRTEFYADTDPLVLEFKGKALDERIRQLHREHGGLAAAFEAERDRTTTFARVLRKSGDFPLAKPRAESNEGDDESPRPRRRNDQNAHEDLSKYFVDRSLRLARSGGFVGLVIPAGVYNGDGCVGIRQYLLTQAAITAFYGFENRRKVFPIDSRYKFANLVARIGDDGSGAFDAAFMRRDLDELSDSGPKPWTVHITRAEVDRLSPNTLALLEYQGPRDQQIVHRMSAGRPMFGGMDEGAWGTRLIGWRQHEIVYNSTEDRDLVSDPATGGYFSVESVLGPGAPRDSHAQIEAMRALGYWPLFGGEQIAPFVIGVKPFKRWISTERAEAKYRVRARAEPTLVFRDQARSTDERSCIAVVLPSNSSAAYTLTAAVFEHVKGDSAAAVLNSLCFDFLLRIRLAGMHVSGTYILPVAVPPAAVTDSLPRIPARFAIPGRNSHLTDDPESWPELWAVDRAVAEAYGLGPEEFRHILATFPVWRRKRPEFAEYYDAKLTEWGGE